MLWSQKYTKVKKYVINFFGVIWGKATEDCGLYNYWHPWQTWITVKTQVHTKTYQVEEKGPAMQKKVKVGSVHVL